MSLSYHNQATKNLSSRTVLFKKYSIIAHFDWSDWTFKVKLEYCSEIIELNITKVQQECSSEIITQKGFKQYKPGESSLNL